MIGQNKFYMRMHTCECAHSKYGAPFCLFKYLRVHVFNITSNYVKTNQNRLDSIEINSLNSISKWVKRAKFSMHDIKKID